MEKLLTVILPTKGDDRVMKTINSLRDAYSDIDLIIVADNVSRTSRDQILFKAKSLQINSFMIPTEVDNLGKMKQEAIERVNTPYFMILTDDMILNKGAIDMVLHVISSQEPNWISHHFFGTYLPSQAGEDDIRVIETLEQKTLIDPDNFDPEDYILLNPLNIIFKTEVYKEFTQEDKKLRFRSKYLDYILPNNYVIANYPGVDIGCVLMKSQLESEDLNPGLSWDEVNEIIPKIHELILTPEFEVSRYWMKVLMNIYKDLNPKPIEEPSEE